MEGIWYTIPGPLLFGLVFDSACVYPQHKIGEMGNCWIYDNERLSYYALVLLAALFAGLSWFTYPKERTVKSDEESKNNEFAHSDPSDQKCSTILTCEEGSATISSDFTVLSLRVSEPGETSKQSSQQCSTEREG